MPNVRGLIGIIGCSLLGLLATAGAASAQLKSADVGINPTFEQTGASTVNSTGGFFSARAFFTSSTDYATGTLTYGGSGSPATLSYVPADIALEFGDSNGSFPTLQTLYPTGDYTFDLTGGSEPEAIFTIDYAGGAYSNTPALAASSFSALQGMNSADPLTVLFNGFDVASGVSNSDIVFSISNSSDVQVFNSGFLAADATGVTIPGGTLSPGQSYTFDLLYSSQIFGEVDALAIGTTQFYDSHTDGSFSTAAIPEPSTWAMLLMGFVGIGVMLRRRSSSLQARAA
jgi:hypothetical protein